MGADGVLRSASCRSGPRPSLTRSPCLAYVQWHLKQAWSSLLFADEQLSEHRKTRDPVALAEPTADVKAKKATRKTADGLEIHSFLTLLDGLGTQCRNACEFGERRTLVCLTNGHRTHTAANSSRAPTGGLLETASVVSIWPKVLQWT